MLHKWRKTVELRRLFKLTLFSIFLITVACSKNYRRTKEFQVYVISKEDAILNAQWNETTAPPPLPLFYGDYNFIVDKSEHVYLHQKKYPFRYCGTGVDYSMPDFINLHPKDISLVDSLFLGKFLRDSTFLDKMDKQIAIASFGDTVKSKQIMPLIKFIAKSGKVRRWSVRKITEEEAAVLAYKKSNKDYDADSIQWTTSFSTVFEVPKRK